MLVANPEDKTYKNFVCQNHKACRMPFKYDLILNIIISLKSWYI